MIKLLATKFSLVVAVGAIASCAADDGGLPGEGGNCNGGKCDEADGEGEFGACVLHDDSGRSSVDADILATLNDPVANLILRDDRVACPGSFDEIVDKLRVTDTNDCQPGGDGRNDLRDQADQLDEEAAGLEAAADEIDKLIDDLIAQIEAAPDDASVPVTELAIKILSDDVNQHRTDAEGNRQRAEDLRDDADELDGGEDRRGLLTRIVSDRAQLVGSMEAPRGGRAPTRAVVTRQCSTRQSQFEMIFSLLGVSEEGLPQNNTELIGFDQEAGVFNYYTLRPRTQGGQPEWTFHGNSLDFVTPGNQGECGACHTGGGLIMKEHDAPWVHWEGDTNTPGADEIVAAHENLGAIADGINMENQVVDAGNQRWNQTRIDAASNPDNVELHGGSMAPLLAPLFCDSEFNLQSSSSVGFIPPIFPGPGPIPFPIPEPLPFPQFNPLEQVDLEDPSPANGNVNFLSSDFFAPGVLSAGGVTISADDYQRALVETQSRIQAADGSIVQRRLDANEDDPTIEPAIDTFFGFTFPEAAASDLDYLQQLRNTKLPEGLGQGRVIDQAFVEDVQAVDFTVPVFSRARCDLLEFAPTFDQFLTVDLGAEEPDDKPEAHACCEAKPQIPNPQPDDFDITNHVGCVEDEAVEEAVCAQDPFCCGEGGNGFWDGTCARATENVAGEFCGFQNDGEESETTQRIRLAMIENLKAAQGRGDTDSPAAQLLTNLSTPSQNHRTAVQEFMNACNERARPQDFLVPDEGEDEATPSEEELEAIERDRIDFIIDVLTVAAGRRAAARAFRNAVTGKKSSVLEFGETMVSDDLPANPAAHLDPLTCELVD